MTSTVRRITLGLGAGLIALGVTAGVYASAQNTNQDPRPFSGPGQGRRGPGGRGGPMGPSGPGGPMGMLPMLGPRIGLTDAQQAQIKSIADSHRDEWKALADRARTAHGALNEAVTADAMDEGLIRSDEAALALHRLDDVLRGDPEAIEKFVRFSTARDLADRQPAHTQPGVGDGFRNRVPNPASRIVILDGDQTAAGRTAGLDETVAIDWRHRVQIDDANGGTGRFQLVVRLDRLEDGDARANHRSHVIRGLA
jgi:Spy/CpxP family protein refolding chaperone